MGKQKNELTTEVTSFLDALKHPLRKEIQSLRELILTAESSLSENIKWNGPNYVHQDEDRITMKIQPPKTIHLIFHRGAKVRGKPDSKLIQDVSGVLVWKGNDRAVATFKTMTDIEQAKPALNKIIKDWLRAAK